MGVACVTPMPFCSLTPTHTNALRLREAYDDPLISAFAEHFGQPAFEATVDEKTGRIEGMKVVRDADYRKNMEKVEECYRKLIGGRR